MRALLIGLATAAAMAGEAKASEFGPSPEPGVTRPVILVGNNWDGTTDVVDPETFERLDRINVVPDYDERIAEFVLQPDRVPFFLAVRNLIGEGHDQLNDDVFSSNDGRYIYVSRPSLADVVSIDLRTKKIVWRAPVDGYRSDHMAISQDGKRLLVSASTGNVVHELDTATGERTAIYPSGDSPHENVFSKDGRRIFHASIGRVYSPSDRMDVADSATQGGEYFQIMDTKTNKVLDRFDMGEKLAEAGHPGMSSAVRPMALSPDERFVYFQVSFFHGFVEFDLDKKKVTRVANLPIPERVKQIPREQYLLNSAHHGLAMDREGKQLCVAGTMSDYGALVDRETFKTTIVDDAITKPYWSTNSADGRYCYISGSGDDAVNVISYATKRKIAEFKVGYHPQRVRNGVARIDIYPQGKFGERFDLRVTSARRLRFAGGGQRVGCAAAGAVDLRLVRCKVTLRSGGRLIGTGERFVKRGARAFKVTVKGRRSALRRLSGRRVRISARGVDSVGRVATARSRARLR